MITYVDGNIIDVLREVAQDKDYPRVFVPHVVNDDDVIGSGVARALFELYPTVKRSYHKWFKSYPKMMFEYDDKEKVETTGKAKLGQCQYITTNDDNITVVNMIAQSTPGINWYPYQYDNKSIRHPLPPIRYESLEECMVRVTHKMQEENVKDILTVKFGSGLAGGNWDKIESLIEKLWASVGINVTVFVPKG